MAEQDERGELLARYASGPEQVARVLEGLADGELDTMTQGTGEWSIRQIVHHIADAEFLWVAVIKAALGDSGCGFDASWYVVGNGWADTLEYARQPIGPAVDLFSAMRSQVTDLVQLLPGAWDRNVLFDLDGVASGKKLTVEDVIKHQVTHTQQHIDGIRDTRMKHGRADVNPW